MINFREIAEKLFREHRMNIIPLKGGKKSPSIKWKDYVDRRQTEQEALNIPFHSLTGLAIILGEVSDYLACIDIDAPLDRSVSMSVLKILGLPDDYVWHIKSANGGDHIYFRCKELSDEFEKSVIVLKGTDDAYKQIELRINKCLIVAPGSRVDEDKVYTFRNNNNFSKPVATVGIGEVREFLKMFDKEQAPNSAGTTQDVTVNEHRIKGAIDEVMFDRVSECVQKVIERDINLCENYNDWRKIGLSLVDEFGSQGREFFHQVSRVSKKYKSEECEKFYTSLCETLVGDIPNPITIATFFFYCRKHNIFPSGKKSKKKKKSDAPSPLQLAVELMRHRYKFDYDTLTSTLFCDGKRFEERDFNTLFIDLLTVHELPGVNKDFIYSFLESSHIPKFNRVERLMDGYEPKVREGNIKKLADTLVTKTGENFAVELNGRVLPYKEAIIELYLVKMVKQIFENDANEFCLVLLGDMAIGKTSWFTRLLPSELNDLAKITQFTNDKDFKVQLTENLLLIIDEIRERDMASNEFMKLTMTTPSFSLRVPYARKQQTVKRVATLAGTGNSKTILRDPTGNRRFVCFWLDNIDRELFNSIDKRDLFFEAISLYRSGYNTQVLPPILHAISTVSRDFEIETESDSFITSNFSAVEIETVDTKWLSVKELHYEIFNREKQKISFFHINSTLTRFGYKSKICSRKSQSGLISKVRCYLVLDTKVKPKVDPDLYHMVSDETTKKFPDLLLEDWKNVDE